MKFLEYKNCKGINNKEAAVEARRFYLFYKNGYRSIWEANKAGFYTIPCEEDNYIVVLKKQQEVFYIQNKLLPPLTASEVIELQPEDSKIFDCMNQIYNKNFTYKDVLIKPFRYFAWPSSNWYLRLYHQPIKEGRAVLFIDKINNTIKIERLFGPAPYAEDIFLFLLSDKDVRREIKQYQEKKREERFAIRFSEGYSGKIDVYMNFYTEYGLQYRGKNILYISPMGKLIDPWYNMYIGDFAEVVAAYFKEYNKECILKIADPKKARLASHCQYVKGYFAEHAKKEATKLL